MRPSLLLVEDSSSTRKQAAAALVNQGWRVVTRAGTESALLTFLDLYDVFVLDVGIYRTELRGSGNGIELAKAIRTQGVEAPIVIWSGEDHAAIAAERGYLYAPKDARCRALLTITSKLLEARRRAWRENVGRG